MAYVRRHWVDYPSTETPIDADALNNIEDGIEESHNIQLLAVTDTAPSECAEGDKYFDTTTKLIYTATGTDEWGETGETPIADILYIVLEEQSTYTYDGTDLVSVGGSSVVNEYSTGTGVGYSANYLNNAIPTMANSYSASTTDGYSANYVNELLEANYCWASMSGDYTIHTINTQETLPINTKTRSSGSKLNVTSDGIIIGAGINTVLVSAQVYWYSNCADSEGVVYIYKNDQNLYAYNHRITDVYEHQPTTTIAVTVAEGDIIRVKVNNNHKTALIKNYASGTFLIVTAIG